MDWCPWQSGVLAIGGGMKDGCLHILDINAGKSIQTPSTNSQVNISSGLHLHFDLLESCENSLWQSLCPQQALFLYWVHKEFEFSRVSFYCKNLFICEFKVNKICVFFFSHFLSFPSLLWPWTLRVGWLFLANDHSSLKFFNLLHLSLFVYLVLCCLGINFPRMVVISLTSYPSCTGGWVMDSAYCL